jgi:hypothetical protein
MMSAAQRGLWLALDPIENSGAMANLVGSGDVPDRR